MDVLVVLVGVQQPPFLSCWGVSSLLPLPAAILVPPDLSQVHQAQVAGVGGARGLWVIDPEFLEVL